MLRVVPMSDPQVSIEVAGAFKRFVASCSSMAARHWTVEWPYTVRIARAISPVVLLTLFLGEIIFVATRAFFISLL